MFRLAFFAVMFFSTTSLAATCVQNSSSDCEPLGYTQSSCPNGGVACPYDKTKWHCAKWTCEDGRYSSTKTNNKCVTATYKGMTCYDCSSN